jgi:hypothetical protein
VIPYTQAGARSHIDAHTLVDIRNTNARVFLSRTYYAHTHHCKHAVHRPHWSAWSVELWPSAAAMCCAPSAPTLLPKGCTHMRVRCTELTMRSHLHTSTRIEVQLVRALSPTSALYNAVGWRENREDVDASCAGRTHVLLQLTNEGRFSC